MKRRTIPAMAAPKSSKSTPEPEPEPQPDEPPEPRPDAPDGSTWADFVNRDRSKDPE